MKLFNNRSKDDGYAVAELAITLPALMSVFAICLWSLGIGLTKLQIESYTISVARTLARGEAISEVAKSNAPRGMQIQINELNNRINVKTSVQKQIPVLNKTFEVTGYAEAMSEIYETAQ